MASLQSFRALDAAIETTPLIDNHCHNLLKPECAYKTPLLSIASEAQGVALRDSENSLAHIRATKHLAAALDLDAEPTWKEVEDAIDERRQKDGDGWIKRCMRGIETLLIDDGYGSKDVLQHYAWHDQHVRSRCKRIVRIETLAADLFQARMSAREINTSVEDLFTLFLQDFKVEIERAIGDYEVAGFKSIICYRGGLDIPKRENVSPEMTRRAFHALVEIFNRNENPFRWSEQLPINHLLLHMTARLIQETRGPMKKPIQFHTGLGDTDITLCKSSPSHLQPFITQYPGVPIVLLHSSYPWTREAAYLATMYTNVYADLGEVFPILSRDGQVGIFRQILELCPWSKIMMSTDGHSHPEMYLISTTQIRSVMKTVIGDFVQRDQISEKQAIKLVQDILFNNANLLYGLRLDSPSASTSLLATPGSGRETLPGKSWPKSTVIEKLRALNCKWLRVCWHDYTSAARVRLIPMQRVLSLLEAGKVVDLTITKASLGLLQTDTTVPGVSATGMYNATPDWSSLKLGPAPGHASVFCEFKEEDGTNATLCPRTILRHIVETSARQGLTFLLGFELEFVIVERNPDRNSPEKYITMRNDGHAWSMNRVLADTGREGSFNTAMDEILDSLTAAGILIEQFHPENALGQYELVLPPLPPLEACDSLLHARAIVEAVAARHNFRMTLHPKPFATNCGSATHMHISLTSPSGDHPAVYRPFYAGILQHFPSLIALLYGNPASYERMVDSAWAGGRWVTWGTQNKEAPLRRCEGSHWELKTFDGLTNPYFAVAAVLAAGSYGVGRGEEMVWGDCLGDPARLSETERNRLGIMNMFPKDLTRALEALRKDQELTVLLGAEFVERYIAVKMAEIAMLEPMSPEERRQWIMERY